MTVCGRNLFSANMRENVAMRFSTLHLLAMIPGLFCMSVGYAQKVTTEYVWPNGAPDARGDAAGDKPTLTFFFPAPSVSNGAAVIVCPGGAYRGLVTDREGDDVARWFNSIGVTGIVLRYRHAHSGAGYRYPTPLLDAQHSLSLIRSRARDLGINPGKIGVLGFSAGGHLAASLGTHFTPERRSNLDPMKDISCRPDFMILVYPVITMDSALTHAGSRESLLGPHPDKELVDLTSIEKQVTPESPPAFLVTTTDDQAVPVENSVLMYSALRKAGVPVEMHIFQHGDHGFDMGIGKGAVSAWPELCKTWLKNLKMIPQ